MKKKRIEEHYIPASHANICFDCRRACGGCSWSEIDPETNKVRFEMPIGCKTEKIWRRKEWSCESIYYQTLRIVSCPLFVHD